MAARCTTPPAAMHHLCGSSAPFRRWRCTIICGQVALFERCTQPHRKGLEDFDFVFQPSIDKRQVEELGTLAFVAREENVILLGPPGVGKTHLAVGLALKALDAGMVVYYTTLSHLITDLKKAQLQGRLERRWRVYRCTGD